MKLEQTVNELEREAHPALELLTYKVRVKLSSDLHRFIIGYAPIYPRKRSREVLTRGCCECEIYINAHPGVDGAPGGGEEAQGRADAASGEGAEGAPTRGRGGERRALRHGLIPVFRNFSSSCGVPSCPSHPADTSRADCPRTPHGYRQVRDEINRFLEDDSDMRDMYLTRKAQARSHCKPLRCASALFFRCRVGVIVVAEGAGLPPPLPPLISLSPRRQGRRRRGWLGRSTGAGRRGCSGTRRRCRSTPWRAEYHAPRIFFFSMRHCCHSCCDHGCRAAMSPC